ncbi:MAG TPA: hypothetical protein DDZ38_00365, partial [Gammaproteobacteria bacterium]|nr:hypothetical protein [Gammaproteobacteria bacterium]
MTSNRLNRNFTRLLSRWFCMNKNSATLSRRRAVAIITSIRNMPEYIALYLLLGVFSGFLAGMLGIGGGVVIVPALYLIYTASNKFSPELALLVALATSLTCITLTSASAAWAQIRAQRVHWDAFSGLLPWLLVGSAASGFIAPLLPSDLLRTLLGCLLGCVAVVMLLSWQ